MTNLKDINFGMNQYCGPAVLSALTGESTDRCAAVISAVSGKKEIKAVEKTYLREALRRLRFDVEEIKSAGSTLYGTLYRIRDTPGIYVMFVPHHVVAIEIKSDREMYLVDNHSKQPLDVKQSARLLQKCEGGWKVSRKAEPKFLRSEIVTYNYNNKIDIVRKNIYENSEDNTTESLGYLKAKDSKDLENILYRLHSYYESGEFHND